ncbi:MAG: tRNA pseudouridine(38-40) synthase TruA, partial [Christensenellales bacterium]
MLRYKLTISYDGSKYLGFQTQKVQPTIQEILEDSLSKVIGEKISIVSSGRTDAGVSAIEQICHFDVEKSINENRIKGYTNSLLPNDIRIIEITQ